MKYLQKIALLMHSGADGKSVELSVSWPRLQGKIGPRYAKLEVGP